jgi:histidine ammonia-lyase
MIVDNLATMISIEALLAFRALSFRHPKKSSIAVEELFEDIRRIVPDHIKDRYFGNEFMEVRKLLFRRAGL